MSIVALTKFRISCSKRKIFKILTLKIPQQNKSVEKNGFTKADRVGFTKSVKADRVKFTKSIKAGRFKFGCDEKCFKIEKCSLPTLTEKVALFTRSTSTGCTFLLVNVNR